MTPLPLSETRQLDSVLLQLPPLPSSLRYWDDYLDMWHHISDLADTDIWPVKYEGRVTNLRFDCWSATFRPVVKHIIAELFSRVDDRSVLIHHFHLVACT